LDFPQESNVTYICDNATYTADNPTLKASKDELYGLVDPWWLRLLTRAAFPQFVSAKVPADFSPNLLHLAETAFVLLFIELEQRGLSLNDGGDAAGFLEEFVVLVDDKWKDKIVINTTSYRFPYNINFKLLSDLYKSDLIFISSSKSEHEDFENKTQCSTEYYKFTNFEELSSIINSCKLYAGSPSAPLSIAHSLHKERICGLISPCAEDGDDNRNLGLRHIFPNIRYEV
jgi:hypothetical protein